jgi:oligopeptide/dipeptide ABC transporter ATP-binding protein
MSDLLELEALGVSFETDGGTVSAVSDISLRIEPGQIFGLVGESGCGKTTLAMSLMGLLPKTATVTGSIRFQGDELRGLSEERYRELRGNRISMIFQDPMTSLDPAYTVGSQIGETIRAHRDVDAKTARRRAVELLVDVGIPEPERRYDDPPHRLSGGMHQRVVIATALANEPALLVADEPTTALDVTIQSQVLDLLRALRVRHHTTIMLITHDLGVVAQVCDRVGVMYAGQLVEVAPAERLFREPRHPYTQALLAALPTAEQKPGGLRVIAGRLPDLTRPPSGCRFTPRCSYRMPECDTMPALVDEGGGHEVACWLSDASRSATIAGSVSAPAGGSA